jgi:hypothetical protein
MNRSLLSIALGVAIVSGGALAACGGGNTTGPGPQTPGTTTTSTTTTTTSTTTSTTTGTGTTTAPTTTASTPPTGPADPTALSTTPFHGAMKMPVATAMGAELQSLGLDPKALPPLMKLDPQKLRKVMSLFTKALGGKCQDCHKDGDMAAPTPRKKVAEKMWNVFSRELAMKDGAPLFCDSCHNGSFKALDRTDKKALAKWMDDAFVDKLKRKDGKDHGCESSQCHGPNNDMNFVQNWAK